jgi:hypothetical protein
MPYKLKFVLPFWKTVEFEKKMDCSQRLVMESYKNKFYDEDTTAVSRLVFTVQCTPHYVYIYLPTHLSKIFSDF